MGAMMTLAKFALGRMILHVIAMAGDHSLRFHVAGIAREFAEVVRWGGSPAGRSADPIVSARPSSNRRRTTGAA